MKQRATKAKPETVKVGNITVPIYKRERRIATRNYTVYEIADYTTGIRRLRSFSDHADARREVEKIARQIAAGGTTAATLFGTAEKWTTADWRDAFSRYYFASVSKVNRAARTASLKS